MRLLNAAVITSNNPAPSVSMRCPKCGQSGTFEALGVPDVLLAQDGLFVGSRRCPRRDCATHVFIVRDRDGIVEAYPPEVIDFDTTNVPPRITEALSEAITCHANECYVAAAIMVRKTLEELCADRAATGNNLKERIAALGTKVVLPQDLLDGLDDLRLLGNDAAHIESKEYDAVGREEVEIGIEVAKEVLKAAFQMSNLVNRLRALKAQPPSGAA